MSGEGPALWKALEAVVHDQASTLRDGWNRAPREQRVHGTWFDAHDAGKIWTIAARERDAVTMRPGTGTGPGTRDATPRPTPDQQRTLAQLNRAQSAADAIARRLAAAQTELHTRWWQVCRSYASTIGTWMRRTPPARR
jgi:hypothetical protein